MTYTPIIVREEFLVNHKRTALSPSENYNRHGKQRGSEAPFVGFILPQYGGA